MASPAPRPPGPELRPGRHPAGVGRRPWAGPGAQRPPAHPRRPPVAHRRRPASPGGRQGGPAAPAGARGDPPARRPAQRRVPGSPPGPAPSVGRPALRRGRRRPPDRLEPDGPVGRRLMCARPKPDRELETWVVADRSASLDFGTTEREKRELVLAAVAAFGFLTRGRRQPPRPGRRRRRAADPRRGRLDPQRHARLARPVSTTSRATSSRRPRPPTSPPALASVERVHRRRGQVVVVSDFLDTGDWATPLRRLGLRHQVVARAGRRPRVSSSCPRSASSRWSTPRRAARWTCRRTRPGCGRATRPRPGSGNDDHRGGHPRRRRRTPVAVHRRRLADRDRALRRRRRQARRAGRRAGPAGARPSRRTVPVTFLSPGWLVLLDRARSACWPPTSWPSAPVASTRVRFTSVDLLASVAPRRPGWQRHIPAVLCSAPSPCSSSGSPIRRGPRSVARQRARSCSRSTRRGRWPSTDVAPTGSIAAQEAARRFVNGLPSGMQVGLLSFDSSARMLVAPDHRPDQRQCRHRPARDRWGDRDR